MPTTARTLLEAAAAALIDDRRELTIDELRALVALPDESVPQLAALAHEVRVERCGPEVEVESILSAKTGGCPEDCHFCSQSGRFETTVRPEPFLPTAQIIAAARSSEAQGATEFCIVLAVRGPDQFIMRRTPEAGAAIR